MALKGAKNKQMATNPAALERNYFFPKSKPPVSVRARSRAEAEEKLQAINDIKSKD